MKSCHKFSDPCVCHFNDFESKAKFQDCQKVTSTWGLSLFDDFLSRLIVRKRICLLSLSPYLKRI